MDACRPCVNEWTTEQLTPIQETCCYCIPQRSGLILLALIKLMLSLVLLVILIQILFLCNLFDNPILLYHIIIWIAICTDIVDGIMAFLFITSVCLKERRVMKMYYIYSIFVFGTLTFICSVVVIVTTFNLVVIVIFLILFLFIFIIQEYLNHLVKKEIQKVESSEQFQL